MNRHPKRVLAALLALLALALPSAALGQTATLLPNGRQQFFDANGDPLSGGSVFMYVPPATTTPKTTWQDAGRSTPNSSPITLDSAGTALIYGVGGYRQIVKDALGNTIWDAQTASTGGGGSGGGGVYVGTSTGTGNAQVLPASTFSNSNGEQVSFTAGFSNSGPMTLNAGFGVWPVVADSISGPAAFVGGEVVATNYITVAWDSLNSRFHLVTSRAQVVTAATTAVRTWLATPNSANLAAAVTDETGSGALVFANGATLGGVTNSGEIDITHTGNAIKLIRSVATARTYGMFVDSSGNFGIDDLTSVARLLTLNAGSGNLATSGSVAGAGLAVSGTNQLNLGAGGQIVFPGTPNPSSNVNTLDAYAEGNWTPGMSFNTSTAGVTYSLQSGHYTKIGNIVFATGIVILSSNGSGVGPARITGLPFTSATTNYAVPGAQFADYSGTSAATGIYLAVESTATTAKLLIPGATQAASATDTNVTDNFNASFSFVYQAAN